MRHKTQYTLLTFYKFIDIPDPILEVQIHLQLCTDIGMKGRIYIGEEWISATVSCNTGQLMIYKNFLHTSKYFQNIPDIDIKARAIKTHAFEKMIVKYRKEIVALGITVNEEDVAKSYQKISIDDFKKIIESDNSEYEILDMRNSYEYNLGHFKKALPAATINFKEVKALTKKYMHKFENKKVIMYCTGGIRCEKLSVLLNKEWITNFYALDGGVVKYVNTFNDGNWLGNLYTFDGLVSTQIGDNTTHTQIGQCIYTGRTTDFVENCRYGPCNARIIANKKEYKQHLWFCSQECFDKAKVDLFIKPDFSFDPHDYKNIRGDIKSGKRNFEITQKEISVYLDKALGNTHFNHTTSQKEEYVDACMVDQYYPDNPSGCIKDMHSKP